MVEFPRLGVNEQHRKRFHKIRYVDTIGIANSTEDTEYEEELPERLVKDKFLEFEGKEIY